MHPDIAQAVAQAHVDDLHRAAARQRLARSARTRRTSGHALRDSWSAARSAVEGFATRAVTARRQPHCCPA